MSLFKSVFVEELEVRNPLVLLNAESITSGGADDTHDIGLFGSYWDGTSTKYAGIFRDATDSTFKFFNNLSTLPTVDTGVVADVSSNLANLSVNSLSAAGDIIVTGNLTVNGTTTTINVNTIIVEDNIVIANSGPSNQKEDAGFVVKRIPINIDDDTPKQTGTASASGTTTTVRLQAANGHGTALNYYTGWVIKFGGDVTGTATVTSSTAADPPVLTFDTAASAGTTTSTTYQLFNKRYVGTIYDESTDLVTFYGFPREDAEAVVDPAGNSGNGNLADFLSIKGQNITAAGNVSTVGLTATGTVAANVLTSTTTITAGTGLTVTSGNLAVSSGNLTVSNDLTVSGVIKAPFNIDDNIIVANSGPTNLAEDGGFVTKRTPVNVAADTPKETGTASASGTSTTVRLQAANSHGTTLNYYAGWIIKFGGDVTGTATVLSSTAANPPLLTFDTAASAGTTTSTTYQLFNKRYVGSIYDESMNKLIMVGFPREVGETVIDPASPVNGNVPDYVNLAVADLTITGTFSFSGTLTHHSKTETTGLTWTTQDMYEYELLILNPTGGNTTYTLPTIVSLSIPTDTAIIITFINIHASNTATIAASAGNTIEGDASAILKRQWMKFTLIALSGLTTWLIR